MEHTPTFFLLNAKGEVILQLSKFQEENFQEFLEVVRRLSCNEKPYTSVMNNRYYGEMVCAPCHPKIQAWQDRSAHAKAYNSSAKEYFGKHGFRKELAGSIPPEVLVNCTVGFGEPTGYDPNKHQTNLLGVQCESCHGPAGPHAGHKVSYDESRCIKCHTSTRDPAFYYRSALLKLGHPKEP